ncbi:MAG: hypothetical protein AAF993_05105 [Pseudomonadota bacterium]
MKYVTTVSAIALAAFGFSASANAANYGQSLQSCKSAITGQLNVTNDEVRMKVRNIKTRASNRELRFHVYSNAPGAKRSDKVVVDCTVAKSGELLALNFDDKSQLPVALTTQAVKSES